MDQIHFDKMSGSGNDFIIIDNRGKIVPETDIQGFVARICRRKMAVGADGVILVEDTDTADFKWRFFNSDGSVAEMCGNGARCVSRFAFDHGIAGATMTFETLAGVVRAQISDRRVTVSMPDPTALHLDENIDTDRGTMIVHSVNTGVPHVVIETPALENVDVVALGREIRHHPRFLPSGTNVNFMSPILDNGVAIRTYERGVEDETLACGTGAVAAAIICAAKDRTVSPVELITRSGERLVVSFHREGSCFTQIYLEGDARIIYKGILWPEAWELD